MGVEELRAEVLKAGAHVNRKRKRHGVNPRAIRVALTGFPNVGKSSIINVLTGRKVAKKGNSLGDSSSSTKKLTWHRIGGFRNTELEFLDTPGLIPLYFGKRYTEEQANLLCMVHTFSLKVYDRLDTAQALMHHLAKLSKDHPSLVERGVWKEMEFKYKVDMQAAVRREVPFLPQSVPVRNPEAFVGKILSDFQHGMWGKIQLEPPPNHVVAQMEDYRRGIKAVMEPKRVEDKLKPLRLLSEEDVKEKRKDGKSRELLPVMSMPSANKATDHIREFLPPSRRMEKVHVPAGGGFDRDALFDGW